MVVVAKLHEKKDLVGNTRRIVGVCDADLLGKELKSGKLSLNLRNYRAFYEGKKVSPQELSLMLKRVYCINIVGRESIELVSSIIDLDASKAVKIGGVPHLQYYKL